MNDDALVSVITVTRNDLKGLELTVRSVLEQTYPAIEHLVIDGASDDGSVEFLTGLTHARTLSEPDRGIYDAMNKGLARATGDVLVFMNSGDQFCDSNTVEYVMSHWPIRTSAWGFGAMRYVDAERKPIAGDVQAPFKLRRMELGMSFVPHQAMFISRSLASEIGEFDERFGVAADQEWALRAAYREQPATWIVFMVDFLAGGAHSSIGQLSRSMLYHRMRKKHGRMLMNSSAVDCAAAYVMGIGWTVRDIIAGRFAGAERIRL